MRKGADEKHIEGRHDLQLGAKAVVYLSNPVRRPRCLRARGAIQQDLRAGGPSQGLRGLSELESIRSAAEVQEEQEQGALPKHEGF